jgi:hypothetical protein
MITGFLKRVAFLAAEPHSDILLPDIQLHSQSQVKRISSSKYIHFFLDIADQLYFTSVINK